MTWLRRHYGTRHDTTGQDKRQGPSHRQRALNLKRSGMSGFGRSLIGSGSLSERRGNSNPNGMQPSPKWRESRPARMPPAMNGRRLSEEVVMDLTGDEREQVVEVLTEHG